MLEHELLRIIADTTNPFKKMLCQSFLNQLNEGKSLSYRQRNLITQWEQHLDTKIRIKLKL